VWGTPIASMMSLTDRLPEKLKENAFFLLV
jgi:hypothetical protein